MLQGPGENAGVVDLGDGLACAFKVESHNHPSAVEPFQGAATGVGGILRDIVAMGARPVALLDGLRFGAPDFAFDRAVGGIGHYGNCVGVPTVGGEAVFDDAYRGNPLVNAMCVGLLPAERVTRASASGAGNLVVLYGATTGRDGIGGASVLASQELSDEDEDKRPTVQIGDPFTGKKLIEASLELTEGGLVESLQDLGAAGLASSLAEMAGRGGAGLDVHLDRVPLREPDLEPVEIMISESQERMVASSLPNGSQPSRTVCAEVGARLRRVIGEVTDSGDLRAFFDDEEVGRDPRRAPHRGDAALHGRDQPRGRWRRRSSTSRSAPSATSCWRCSPRRTSAAAGRSTSATTTSSARERCAARGWTRPSSACGRPSAASPSRSTGRAAPRLSTHAPPAPAPSSSRRATSPAQAGARSPSPTASTSATRRSPRSPGSSPRRSREWRARARCSASRSSRATSPSTTRPTGARSTRRRWSAASASSPTCARCRAPGATGDVVLLAGGDAVALDGSEYQARFLGGPAGRPPPPDYVAEAALVHFLWRSASVAVSAAHDVSDGGLAVALAELALHSGIGADLDLDRDALAWFGEGAGRAVVACAPERAGVARGRSAAPARASCGGDRLLGIPLAELRAAYEGDGRLMCGDLRHPRARARRRPPLLLRPLRAPAPRPGVGRHRRLRRRPPHRPHATWAS